MADATAKNSKLIPRGEASKVKSWLNTISIIPAKEIISPKNKMKEIFSLTKRYEKTGVITGIVEIITAAIVEDIIVSPKLSPIK
jgi:hypothetical protein